MKDNTNYTASVHIHYTVLLIRHYTLFISLVWFPFSVIPLFSSLHLILLFLSPVSPPAAASSFSCCDMEVEDILISVYQILFIIQYMR